MKNRITTLSVIIILLTACSVLPAASNPVEITDATGHTAVLEGMPDRIAIAGKATVMV
jgi:ABC-type Fe3+-hydroxamate transport system substrate-binding protein